MLFEQHLKNCQETFPTDLETRFKVGTLGYHELLHTIYVQAEIWESYVVDHCSTSLDRELYDKANYIQQQMVELYQEISTKDYNATIINNSH